jgi:hypothetical protein
MVAFVDVMVLNFGSLKTGEISADLWFWLEDFVVVTVIHLFSPHLRVRKLVNEMKPDMSSLFV